MKICEKEKLIPPPYVVGHLYKQKEGFLSSKGFYLFDGRNTLVNIETGAVVMNTFEATFEDVTDKYCLQEL